MKKQTTAEPAQPPSFMRLEEISERAESTRRISKKHVNALKDSIAAVGLIQPIAVDVHGQLLAGGHRLVALVALQSEQAEKFADLFPGGLVPVRTIALESGEPGALKALEIEMSENEKRRDYTSKEVTALVSRLKQAGYSASAGGPRRKGDKQKHLTEALATVLGKSRRQAQRLLSASELDTKPTAKEAATARCLRAMSRALEAAAVEGSLEQAAMLLADALAARTDDIKRRSIEKPKAARTQAA